MTIAAKPRPMRMNQNATLVPTEQYARWNEIASGTAGLSKLELAVLSAVCEHFRLLDRRGYASSPTLEEMAHSARVRPIDISTAIWGLISRCLLAVRPGSGRWANEYLPALPKRIVGSLAPAAVAEDAPPI